MKRILSILSVFLIVVCLFAGCSKRNKNEVKVDFFGPEIYNASYLSLGDEVVRHIIPIMSKEDLTQAQSIEVEGKGGTYTVETEVEMVEYKIDNFNFYRIVLDFSDINFTDEKITIDKIKVFVETERSIELIPDKCEIVKFDGNYSTDAININGTPIRIPSDMTSIPLELSAEENVIVKNVRLTNQSIKMENYKSKNGEVTDQFEEFTLTQGNDIITWTAYFGIENTDLSTYKQYGTSIIIEYEYNDTLYYTTPAIKATTYNPFDPDFDGIELYYKKLGAK